MTACLAVGAAILHLADPTFTLSWTHSVERVAWAETWRVAPGGLELVTARVKGSGAGMEPGEGAVLRGGWWEWAGDLEVPRLTLAASGATGGGWSLCAGGRCRTIAEAPGDPVTLEPCGPDALPTAREAASDRP